MATEADTLRLQAPERVVALSIAPRFVGWLFCTLLYGITIPVFVNYIHSPAYQKDSQGLRLLICFVMVLLTMQTAFNWEEVVSKAISQDRTSTAISAWSIADCLPPISHGLLGATVQTYLARRCYLLVRGLRSGFSLPIKIIFIGVFATLIIVAFLGALSLSVLGAINFETGSFEGINIAFAVHMATSAVVDCLISGTLIWCLRGHVYRYNEHLVKRIIRMSMTTAAYTAIVATIGAVLAITFAASSVYGALCMPFAFVLPALYTCSLFSTTALRHEYLPPAALRSPFSSASFGLNVRSKEIPREPGVEEMQVLPADAGHQRTQSADRTLVLQ